MAVFFLDQFVATVSELSDFLLGGVLGAGEEELLVVGVGLEVLNLLFAVQHEPALDAEHLSVALGLNEVKLVDELVPVGGVAFNHGVNFLYLS